MSPISAPALERLGSVILRFNFLDLTNNLVPIGKEVKNLSTILYRVVERGFFKNQNCFIVGGALKE